jgi:hypothetical protein
MDRHGTRKQLLWLSTLLLWLMGSGLSWAESQQTERSKGLTLDDLARGVRSAAQNIEKEIPKIGPAVGKTLKSITGNSSEQKPTRESPSDKK